MSYQNRWRDGLICMLTVAAASYYFDLRDLLHQHDDLEIELNRAEIRASIQRPEASAAQTKEVPSYLELLTRLLREYHLQLTVISSINDENYQINVCGSYAELRQFMTALAANSEFIIKDIVIDSGSEMNTQAEFNIQFTSVISGNKIHQNTPAIQFENPFCSALYNRDITSFHHDDIGFLGTVSRGSESHSVVMYPNGVMKEI